MYGTVLAENRAFAVGLEKMQEDMNALKVLEIFRKISPEVSSGFCFVFPDSCPLAVSDKQDSELLALHPDIGRPEDYLWQYVPVPPPCIRPSVASEAGK